MTPTPRQSGRERPEKFMFKEILESLDTVCCPERFWGICPKHGASAFGFAEWRRKALDLELSLSTATQQIESLKRELAEAKREIERLKNEKA